ncbi:MAG: gliding motility lipoprotein GldH [Saprospiraceae bacterium]
MRFTNFFSLLTVGCFLFAGCSDDFIYDEQVDIPGQSWAYEDTLTFDFTIGDITKIYSLTLDVNHSIDYGFQNLYVQFHTRYPSGKTETQVVSLELAKKSGIWNGDCGGQWCIAEIALQPKAIFEEAGVHQIKIEQYMRKSPLPGLKSMELKIKPIGMRE